MRRLDFDLYLPLGSFIFKSDGSSSSIHRTAQYVNEKHLHTSWQQKVLIEGCSWVIRVILKAQELLSKLSDATDSVRQYLHSSFLITSFAPRVLFSY